MRIKRYVSNKPPNLSPETAEPPADEQLAPDVPGEEQASLVTDVLYYCALVNAGVAEKFVDCIHKLCVEDGMEVIDAVSYMQGVVQDFRAELQVKGPTRDKGLAKRLMELSDLELTKVRNHLCESHQSRSSRRKPAR